MTCKSSIGSVARPGAFFAKFLSTSTHPPKDGATGPGPAPRHDETKGESHGHHDARNAGKSAR